MALIRPGPRRHHRDAIGEIDRFLHVMGDEDTVFGVRFQILSSSVCISARVCASSAPNGSSINRMFGIEGERARDRGALLHAAGEMRRIAVLEAVSGRPDR